jgi:hypothetical protein
VAPKAVVEQVAPPAASVVDVNALFDAMAMNETDVPDEASAMMRQIYVRKCAAGAAAAQVKMIGLTPKPQCAIQASMGKRISPSGQNFKAQVGKGAKRSTAFETIDDDGGSPVSLISPDRRQG